MSLALRHLEAEMASIRATAWVAHCLTACAARSGTRRIRTAARGGSAWAVRPLVRVPVWL